MADRESRTGFSFRDLIDRLLGRASRSNGAPDQATMISCDEAMELLYDYLDGELEDISYDQVDAHFRICAECHPRLLFEQSFLEVLERARGGEKASEELRDRILQVLESGEKGAT